MAISLWILIVIWTYEHIVVPFQVQHLAVNKLFYFEKLTSTQFLFEFSTKIYLNFKIFKCSSSPMFCANIFGSQHIFWSHNLPLRKYCINHWHTIKHWRARFIFKIYCIPKIKKVKKLKTLRTKQRSSPHGYIVRPIKGAGKQISTSVNNFFFLISAKRGFHFLLFLHFIK
jgi:hypothetical protein